MRGAVGRVGLAVLVAVLGAVLVAGGAPAQEEPPARAVVVVLHTCELPEGVARGTAACGALVGGLRPGDAFGVVTFGAEGDGWAVDLGPVGDGKALQGALAGGVEVGDMPDFDSALALALEGLVAREAAERHLIVVSDGDPSPPGAALLERARDERVLVSTLCVMPHGGADDPGVLVMRRIATLTGGRAHLLADGDELGPALLRVAGVR